MQKILMIDDDRTFLDYIETYIRKSFPALEFKTCRDPFCGLAAINPDLSLLLLDLEMPGLDGSKLLAYAVKKGVQRHRIVILSNRDSEYLHKQFPMGSCLAVLNKHDLQQKAVLEMIFRSLQKKCSAQKSAES